MPKRRYERREPSHEWQHIQPLLKDPAHIHYEIIRPVVLWGQTPKERGAETGVSPRTIYYRANLFDQAGMASLLPAAPPPEIPRQDKRALPPDIRQEIVDLHTQYPAFRPHELATICFVKFNRKPAPATIKLILASGPNHRQQSAVIHAMRTSRTVQSADEPSSACMPTDGMLNPSRAISM